MRTAHSCHHLIDRLVELLSTSRVTGVQMKRAGSGLDTRNRIGDKLIKSHGYGRMIRLRQRPIQRRLEQHGTIVPERCSDNAWSAP